MPNNTMPVRMEDIDQAEGRSFNARVPTADEMQSGIKDYATSMTDIQQSIKHLGRAIPNGQREGCIVALGHMVSNMAYLIEYMRLNVPDIDDQVDRVIEVLRAGKES